MICHTLLTILQSTLYQTRQASRLCHKKIWLFIVVLLINERLIVCPSMWDQALQFIHCDVSTRVLLVFVRQRGRKITCRYLQYLSFLLSVCFGALDAFWRVLKPVIQYLFFPIKRVMNSTITVNYGFVFLILIQQILELTFLSMQMLLVWSLTEIDVNEPDKVRF